MEKELRNLQEHQIGDFVRQEDVPSGNTIVETQWLYKVKADGK